jgi:hypothetical protein
MDITLGEHERTSTSLEDHLMKFSMGVSEGIPSTKS